MINKGKRKQQKNQKNQKNPRNIINCKSNEPKFYTKMKLCNYKINLAETSLEDFNYLAKKYFYQDLIYNKYFEIGELFSLNKNSSYKGITKINILLDELKINEENSPRVIFFQSPPMIGLSYIVKYLENKHFNFYIWNNSYGRENNKENLKYYTKEEKKLIEFQDGSLFNEYQNMKDYIESNININRISNNNTYFVILRNLPYDLFIMSLKQNNYVANFIKNWKQTLLLFFDLIKSILNSERYKNIKLIFFTDDKEVDVYELRTIFPKDIIDHHLTYKIICNPIAQRKMNDILRDFFDTIQPPIFEDYQNIIENIYLEFGSNIEQILNFLIIQINTRYYLKNSKYNKNKIIRPLTQKGKTKIMEYIQSPNKSMMIYNNSKNNISIKNYQIRKEQQLDHDLFRILGKLLYNKRFVKSKNAICKLKKEEFIDNNETPRYYNLDELINDIPISNNSFNDLLIYNTIDHFNDLEEYADIFDLYSFTDDIDNFDAFLYDKCNQYYFINSYMKTYFNCLGVTTYNMSQYNTNNNKNKFNSRLTDKGLMMIKKPDFKINKNMNKFEINSFFKACEYFPSLISLSIKSFYKEGIHDFFKSTKCSNNDNDKNEKKGSDNNDIKLYYKKKEEKKYFKRKDNEFNDDYKNKENNSREYNSNSPKNILMRNIPEEDKKAFENMFNEDEDSGDEEDIIEEDY